MRTVIFIAVAATVTGATSALAQAPQQNPPDPTITQNEATTPSTEQPDAQPKARMPIRREQPMVPDPYAPSSEGAGTGTSGSGPPDLPQPLPPERSSPPDLPRPLPPQR
jgi:hypothetical protein